MRSFRSIVALNFLVFPASAKNLTCEAGWSTLATNGLRLLAAGGQREQEAAGAGPPVGSSYSTLHTCLLVKSGVQAKVT